MLARALRMAARSDTGHRPIGIARPALMLIVGLRLAVVRLRVAVDARHVRVVGVVDMAVCTDGAVMGQLPVGVVIESCAGPGSGVVASRASRGETSSNVIWNVAAQGDGALPGRLVATVAIGREIARIVAVDVARRAGRCDVRAGKSKTRRRVIELSCRPSRDRMARRAHGGGARKTSCNMVGDGATDRGCAVPRSGMAAHAISRAECVVVADVARGTGSRCWRHMCADKRKARDAVIEGSCVPPGCRVAGGAICHGECGAGRRMYWVVRLLPRRKVALRIATIGRADVQRIVSVDMALAALNCRVLVGQRETSSAVIKFSIGPRGDWMARRAGRSGGWKPRRDVIRHIAADGGCALPRGLVAAHAVG